MKSDTLLHASPSGLYIQLIWHIRGQPEVSKYIVDLAVLSLADFDKSHLTLNRLSFGLISFASEVGFM